MTRLMSFLVLICALLLIKASFPVKKQLESADQLVFVAFSAYHGWFFILVSHQAVPFDFRKWSGTKKSQGFGCTVITIS